MVMERCLALSALISAYQHVEGGDGLKALLPVAGHLLVEHQARQAGKAGATTIVVLVERVPPILLTAIDRLRRQGLRIEVARSIADAADRVHPEEHLLVIGDGIIADQDVLDRIAAAAPPTIVTLPDDRDHVRFERIDASARWGGLMLIDGAQLRGTAAMLGDWDPQSTLLRRVVQFQAARLPADMDAGGLFLIDRAEALETVRDRLLHATRRRTSASWPGRSVYPLFEDMIVPGLLQRSAEPAWFQAGALSVTVLAALGFLLEWPGFGLALVVLGGMLDAVGRRLARMRLESRRTRRLFRWGLRGMQCLALAGCAWWLFLDGAGWGVLLAGGAIMLTMVSLLVERRQRSDRAPLPGWVADADALAWAAVPFALFGAWLMALLAVLGYAIISFAFVQYRVTREIGAGRAKV